ncbi:hypothetical protein T265_06666 [Opisthorchis viverrini]|uniref:Uncharacterized protein n=1 Tax=Opisthorchis viverrini TaxID=6198 RepID=A0A075ADB9_OPIVI|nr:hypothetical protein T265_06666 [Opisthorchis viverrini]KER25969.1 hypothetical protein T265_06666 [Opisthorchis viverrini]
MQEPRFIGNKVLVTKARWILLDGHIEMVRDKSSVNVNGDSSYRDTFSSSAVKYSQPAVITTVTRQKSQSHVGANKRAVAVVFQ